MEMNPIIRHTLRNLILKFGTNITQNARLCDAYLSDLLPDYPQQRRLLVTLVKRHAVTRLQANNSSSDINKLTHEIADQQQITFQEVEAAMAAWQAALNVSQNDKNLPLNTASAHNKKATLPPLFATGLLVLLVSTAIAYYKIPDMSSVTGAAAEALKQVADTDQAERGQSVDLDPAPQVTEVMEVQLHTPQEISQPVSNTALPAAATKQKAVKQTQSLAKKTSPETKTVTTTDRLPADLPAIPTSPLKYGPQTRTSAKRQANQTQADQSRPDSSQQILATITPGSTSNKPAKDILPPPPAQGSASNTDITLPAPPAPAEKDVIQPKLKNPETLMISPVLPATTTKQNRPSVISHVSQPFKPTKPRPKPATTPGKQTPPNKPGRNQPEQPTVTKNQHVVKKPSKKAIGISDTQITRAETVVKNLISESIFFGRNSFILRKITLDLHTLENLLQTTQKPFYQVQKQKVASRVRQVEHRLYNSSARYIGKLQYLCSTAAPVRQAGLQRYLKRSNGNRIEKAATRLLAQHIRNCAQAHKLQTDRIRDDLIASFNRIVP